MPCDQRAISYPISVATISRARECLSRSAGESRSTPKWMPSRKAIFYGVHERFFERREIPIVVSCDGPQLFQDGALGAGDALLARIVSMPSLIPRNDPRTAAPLSAFHMKTTLRFMPAKNKIVEIDHAFPTTVPVHIILVKRRRRLFGSCRYGDDDQGALETSQHSSERVLA